MAEETKNENPTELPKWRQVIGKYKTAIVTVVSIILDILAGEQGIVEGITAAIKAVFGG